MGGRGERIKKNKIKIINSLLFLWQSRTGRLQHFLPLSSTLRSLLDTYLFSFSCPPSAFSCITSGGISGRLQGVCASGGKAVRRREGAILRLSGRTCLAVEQRAEPATGATSPTKTPARGGKADLSRGRYSDESQPTLFLFVLLPESTSRPICVSGAANSILNKKKNIISFGI